MILELSSSTEVEALALARDQYQWYQLKAPVTLNRRGGDVRLGVGEHLGIRHSLSDPTKLRIITDKLPPSIIFTVELQAFQKLAKYMKGIGVQEHKQLLDPKTPISAVEAEFNVKRLLEAFSDAKKLTDWIASVNESLEDWFACGRARPSDESLLMQLRHLFTLSAPNNSIYSYRFTELRGYGKKVELEKGMYIKLRTSKTTQKFQSWSHSPQDSFDEDYKYLLKAEIPVSLVVWCPSMLSALEKGRSQFIAEVKKKYGQITDPEKEAELKDLRKKYNALLKMPPSQKNAKKGGEIERWMDKLKQGSPTERVEEVKRCYDEFLYMLDNNRNEEEIVVAVAGFKGGFVPCQIVRGEEG